LGLQKRLPLEGKLSPKVTDEGLPNNHGKDPSSGALCATFPSRGRLFVMRATTQGRPYNAQPSSRDDVGIVPYKAQTPHMVEGYACRARALLLPILY